MTETTGQGTETHARIPRQHDRRAESPQRTAWAGWVFFAAVMLSLLGTFHVIAGLVAIFDEDYFTVGKNDLVVEVGYNTWGWVHVIGGVIVILAAIALMSGKMWGRIVAVAVAGASAIVNLGFLSAYPAWCSIMIGLDVIVIWAVCVHGSELKDQAW